MLWKLLLEQPEEVTSKGYKMLLVSHGTDKTWTRMTLV